MELEFGLAINPDTELEDIKEFLPYIHMVLVMSVWAGKGGQAFKPEIVEKISNIKKYMEDNSLDLDIEVDGGINDTTSKLVIEAGANILVSGNYILSSENPKSAISRLKESI